ncbi:hypothetical protein ACTNEO_04290 [Gracilibacillus sp. HCP3S3_G5_1]|uniref:hypothetical protein n=2 Tax=unclassified Gracilibacillus TaxID=2625209 RepID=UPI003F8CE9A6
MAFSMAQAVQSFMLKGGGTLGFEGILNDPNINVIDASAIDYASIGAGMRAIRSANGKPNTLILNNGDATDIELLTDTTEQFIAPPNFMNNLETYIPLVVGLMKVKGLLQTFKGLHEVFFLKVVYRLILINQGMPSTVDKSKSVLESTVILP